MDETPFSFVRGFCPSRRSRIVLARADEIEAAGGGLTSLMGWMAPPQGWSGSDVLWDATHVWAGVEPNHAVVISPSGNVADFEAAGITESSLAPGSMGPDRLGDLRDLRMIGSHLYAAGMCRQVYRREKDRTWSRIDAGCVVKPSTKKVVGFNSIDGASENDMYAAGFAGEIWRWNGTKWVQIDTPTNLVLNRVRAVATDEVYVCGKKGVLLRGHADEWDVIEHDVDDELWDVEVFNGDIYLAAEDRLYRLTKKDTLEPVDMKLKPRPTCGSLHAADGVLLSVGRKHVCWTDDGKKWHDITP